MPNKIFNLSRLRWPLLSQMKMKNSSWVQFPVSEYVRICWKWLSDATILHTNLTNFPGVAPQTPLMEGGIPPFHTNPPVALRATVVCGAHKHNFFEPPLAKTCVRAWLAWVLNLCMCRYSGGSDFGFQRHLPSDRYGRNPNNGI